MKQTILILLLFSAILLRAQNNAEFISQTDPGTISPGQKFSLSVTFKNTGDKTWTSGRLYRLGTQGPQDNTIWLNTNRVLLPKSVAPGGQVTFDISLTAPEEEGIFVIQFQMVQDGVEWFGEKSRVIPFANYSGDNTVFTYKPSATATSTERYDNAVAAACLQGIINRDNPVVYFLESGWKHRPGYWLDKLTSEGRWLSGKNIVQLDCIESLLVLAGDKINGVVVWDEDVPASMNVATTIAGVEDLVVFSPEYVENNLDAWGLTIKKDLRGMFTGSETGSAKNDAYRWAIREYLSKGLCSTHFLSLYEDPYLTRKKGDLSYVVTRDWPVKNRSFVYDLSPWGDEAPLDDQGQKLGTDLETYKMMLAEALKQSDGEEMTEVTGFFSFKKYSNMPGHPSKHDPVPTEWETVYLISPYNCYQNTVASSCYNQTIHSQAPAGKLTQNRPADTLKLEQGKTYISVLMADYDSGTPLYDFLVDFWNDPRRGEIPLMWGINPNLYETFPDIISYYYETQTENDYFAADASAAGYMNPNRVKEEYLPLFVEHNKKFYGQLDMTISPMVLDWDEPTAAVKDAFAEFSPDGFATIVIDFHGNGGKGPEDQVWKGMPVTNLLNVVGQINNIDAAASAMSKAIPWSPGNNTSFKMFRIIWSKPTDVIKTIELLKQKRPDLDIEVVDPYNYFKLFKDYYEPTAISEVKSNLPVICYQDSNSDMLYVKAESVPNKVEIYSVAGKLVKVTKSNFNSISINELQPGNMYLVRICFDEGVVVKKIIKE